MGDNAKIEWTDATWNPVTGCTKASQGCKNCYAEREWPRMTRLVPAYAGRDFTDVRTHPDRLEQPLHWKRPRRIFVNSMSDLFHEDVPREFIWSVFEIMEKCPQHTFQILTKRAERMRCEVTNACNALCVGWLPNVWLGVSVEDQAAADSRIQLLIDTPAAVRWVSIEPLIGPVNIKPWLDEELDCPCGEICCDHRRLDWVVVGGESGPNARPMHPEWVRSLRDQCSGAWPGTPFLFKQWGEWVPRSSCYHTFENGQSCVDIDPSATKWPCIRMTESGGNGSRMEDVDGGCDAYMQRTGKKIAGRLLDGVQHDGYPEAKV